MSEPLISRVYSLQIAGYDDSIQKVEALTAAFNKMDAAKKGLNDQLQQKSSAGDTDAVTQLTQRIKELETEMAKLKTQRDSAAKEAALLARAEKDTADALLKTEKATLATAQAEKVRLQTQQLQNKELDRQSSIEAKNKAALEAEKISVDSLQQSYDALRLKRIELEKLTAIPSQNATFVVDSQQLNYDETLSKIKQIKVEEAAYIEQIALEKASRDQSVIDLQKNIDLVKIERIELEKTVTLSPVQSSINGDALALEELQRTEAQLTTQKNERLQSLIISQKQSLEIESQIASNTNSEIAGQEKLVELGEQRKVQSEDISQTFTSKQNIEPPLPVQPFVPGNELEQNILQLVRTREALKGVQTEQKNLKDLLASGKITQAEYDEQVVRAISLELEYKQTAAELTAELKRQAAVDNTIPDSIKNLQARNAALRNEASSIPIVNATPEDTSRLAVINAELDKNNELIRINSDLLTQQKINIGNYQNSFKGALTVVETELTNVNNKLKGTLSVQDIDNYTKKQDLLRKSTQVLSQEFTSSVAQSNAYKNVAKELGVVFGKNSDVFKNFVAQVAIADKPLQAVNKSIKEGVDGGSKYGGVFQKIYSGFKQLANLIPGLGLSGLLLLLLDPLESLGASLFKYITNVKNSSNTTLDFAAKIKALKENLKNLNDVFAEANKESGKQITDLKLLYQAATDANLPLKERLDAVRGLQKEFPDLFKNINQEIILNGGAKDSYDALTTSIQETSKAKAAKNKLDELEAKRLDIAFQRQKVINATDNETAKAELAKATTITVTGGTAGAGSTSISLSAEENREAQKRAIKDRKDAALAILDINDKSLQFQEDFLIKFAGLSKLAKNIEDKNKVGNQGLIGKLQEQIKELTDTQPTLLTDEAIKKNVAQVKKLQDQLDALLGKAKGTTGSKLSTDITEEFKKIETLRATDIAKENDYVNQIQLTRELTFDEERQHTINIEKINIDALNSKIAYIEKSKNLNKEELKDVAEFKEQISTLQLQASQKLQEINKQEFEANKKIYDEQTNRAKKQLESTKAQIELALSFVVVDDTKSEEFKARATKAANDSILREDIKFYNQQEDNYIKYKQSQNKEFDDQSLTLQKKYQERIKTLSVLSASIQLDTSLTDEERVKKTKDIDEQIAQVTEKHYADVNKIAIKYNVSFVDLEQAKNDKIKQGTLKSLQEIKQIYESELKDIAIGVDKSVSDIALKFDNLKKAALNKNDTKSVNTLSELENIQTLSVKLQGDIDVSRTTLALTLIGVKTKEDFEKIISQVTKDQQALNDIINGTAKKINDLQSLVSSKVGNIIIGNPDDDIKKLEKATKAFDQAKKDYSDKKISQEDLDKEQEAFDKATASIQRNIDARRIFGDVVTETFQFAQTAMESYFASEEAKIQRSNQLAQKRLDIELGQAKDRAQSQAERDSLDRQFAAKKDAEDKKAFDKNKKLQIQQAKINLAIEISNDAVKSSQYPFPANLIIFGVLAAISAARYALNVGRINSASYAYGGSPDTTTTRGGAVKGRPHSEGGNPFLFKGRVYEDEVDELSIVRTKGIDPNKVYTVTGTQKQIASAINKEGGGVQFAPGAKVIKLEQGGSFTSGTVKRTTAVLHDQHISTDDKASQLKYIEFDETRSLLTQHRNFLKNELSARQQDFTKELIEENKLSEAKIKLQKSELALSKYVAENQTGILNKISNSVARLFSKDSEAEDIKRQAYTYVKESISETKRSFFESRRLDIDKISSTTSEVLRLDLQRELNKSSDHESVRTEYRAKQSELDKKDLQEKSRIAHEELTINFKSDVLDARLKLIPVFTINNLKSSYKTKEKEIKKLASGGYTGIGMHRDETGKRVAGIVHESEWVSPEWMVKHKVHGATIRQLELIRQQGEKPAIYPGKFASGGYAGLLDSGKYYGENLKPPINPQAYLLPGKANDSSADRTDEKLDKLMNVIAETSRQTNQRIDLIKVQVVTNEITSSQNKIKKATDLGTL